MGEDPGFFRAKNLSVNTFWSDQTSVLLSVILVHISNNRKSDFDTMRHIKFMT